MAVAKNKLQDIYNSALMRLAELESGQHQGLSQMYEKYNETDKFARDDLSKNMSSKQELLAQEIQSFMVNSIARIQSAVDMQSSLTNNCLTRCTQNLTMAASKFDEQLNLTRSRQDVLERDSLDELSAQFSAFVEQSLMGFLQVQNEWSQRLRDKQADFRSDLEQTISTSVTGLRQYEHDLTNNIQTAAIENMARLRAAAEHADEELRSKYQEQADKLQAKLGELDATFQKHQASIMAEAEAQARQSSQELAARLDRMYSGPASGQAALVAKHKAALQTSFESGASVLSGLLEKTREYIAQAAEEKAGVIDAKAKEVRSQIDSDVETLMQKLNSKFEASMKLEQGLLKDNEDISLKMRTDLSALFESFKKNMDNALNKVVVELSRNCRRVAQELSVACRESQSSINSVTSNVQREVDTSVVQILGKIRHARKSAVEKVERAAAGAAANTETHVEQPATKQASAQQALPAPSAEPRPSPELPSPSPSAEPSSPATETKDIFSDAEIWGDMPHGGNDNPGTGGDA